MKKKIESNAESNSSILKSVKARIESHQKHLLNKKLQREQEQQKALEMENRKNVNAIIESIPEIVQKALDINQDYATIMNLGVDLYEENQSYFEDEYNEDDDQEDDDQDHKYRYYPTGYAEIVFDALERENLKPFINDIYGSVEIRIPLTN